MGNSDKKRAILILSIIMGILSLITAIVVIVLGLYSGEKRYTILTSLIPLIIGLIFGYTLLKKDYSEE